MIQPRVCLTKEVSPCKASWPTSRKPLTSGRDRSGTPALTMAEQTAPFQQPDFLYVPSRDVAADLAYFTEVLGGRVVFAVEAMGTRIAAIQLTDGPPLLLLADHLEEERPILVYRVADLATAMADLEPAAGSGSAPWKSPTGRAAPFGPLAATASRCISRPGRRWPPASLGAATSDRVSAGRGTRREAGYCTTC